jgi:hypothetical protein
MVAVLGRAFVGQVRSGVVDLGQYQALISPEILLNEVIRVSLIIVEVKRLSIRLGSEPRVLFCKQKE